MDSAKVAKKISEAALARYISARHQRCSWDRVPSSRDVIRKAADSLLTTNPTGLLLAGPVGSGKTSCLALVARHYILKRIESAADYIAGYAKRTEEDSWVNLAVNGLSLGLTIVTHAELIKQLREYRTGREFSNSFPDSLREPIVMVDDLGRGYDDAAGWNVSLQDEWFDWRWKNHMPLFITTNKTTEPGSRDPIREWNGWERIVDRICDPAFMTTVVLNNESRRRRAFYEKGQN